jgi:hypothetical protein
MKTGWVLVAFSPSSGIGIYIQQEEWHEFDLVLDDDRVLPVPSYHLDGVWTFASHDELLEFARTQYLQDKKQTYYSTLFTQDVNETLRTDILMFLDDSELAEIPISWEFMFKLRDVGEPVLCSRVYLDALALNADNVLQCFRTYFAS